MKAKCLIIALTVMLAASLADAGMCTYRARTCSEPCSFWTGRELFEITANTAPDQGCAQVEAIEGACGFYYSWSIFGCGDYLSDNGVRTSANCTQP